MFAAAWHLLLKPLPWPEADRLVQIWNTVKRTGDVNVLAPANYLDIERESRTLERWRRTRISTLRSTSPATTIRSRPACARSPATYFEVFGSPAWLGRTLTRADEQPGAFVAVISHGLWRRQFGGAFDVIGRRIQLDDRGYEIVGVMSASFDPSTQPPDAWVPYAFSDKEREQRLGFFLGAIGRLKPGVFAEHASSEIATIADRASTLYPSSNANVGGMARPLREELLDRSAPPRRFLPGAQCWCC